jgi:8-amino-7-oxononanoate synthase
MGQVMESPLGARTVIDGREVDYFSGSGYLGLQSHPAVLLAASNALQRYGFSTATSRGGYGEHPLYHELEKEACAFFDAQKILYFPSGYMGVPILTQSSNDPQDHYFIDSAAHFSLWDAAYLTNKPITPFLHLRPERLAECLGRELLPGERPLVLSDGLFPISGEIAPLPAYLELVEPHQGQVYLDDSHALGVLGANGRGTPEYFAIQNENCRTSGTLSKALGGYGGLIFGKAAWIDHLERNSRICIGASPLPLPVAAASAAALLIARENPALRQSLWANVARARAGFGKLGWELEDTPSPILCLRGRDGINLADIRKGLFEHNIAIELIHSYTSTPAGGALRIAIFATHTHAQIDRMLNAFRRWV